LFVSVCTSQLLFVEILFILSTTIFPSPPPVPKAERKLLKETAKFYFFNDAILHVKYRVITQGKTTNMVVERIKRISTKSNWEVQTETNSFKIAGHNSLYFSLVSDTKKIIAVIEELKQDESNSPNYNSETEEKKAFGKFLGF
ncbi:hypothetical protein M1146_05285, partial [Patescibacteria group bacterium]|nr:hypothetical protein [Patescibacteria group bacterium]